MRTLITPIALSLMLMACNNGTDTDSKDTEDTDATMETDTTMETDVPVETDVETTPTIVEALTTTPRFSHLAAAVVRADLVGAATGVTVFAPNDDAFEEVFTALSIDSVEDLSVEQLTAVLTYHIIANPAVDSTAAVAAAGTSVATLGGSVAVAYDNMVLTIDDAEVITPDIPVSDGVVHEIDSVLIPSITDVVSSDPGLTTLFAAIGAVDADASNPMLGATLDGDGTFTLFAPTDDAFGTLLSSNEGLDNLDDVVGALGVSGVVNVLQYHVLDSTVPAAQAITLDGSSTNAINSAPITIDVVSGSVILNQGVNGGLNGVNDATVLVTDIMASNGIIHKISNVLVPDAD